jgi:mannose-6-phosphate isomerase-like protein (cupin superfamily)
MLVKDVAALSSVRSADDTELREVLHPERDRVSLGYSLAYAVIEPGKGSVPHRLASSEVYYILGGTGTMHVDRQTSPVHPGQAIYVPPGSTQWIENGGPIDLAFLCIVDPAWKSEDEEVVREE